MSYLLDVVYIIIPTEYFNEEIRNYARTCFSYSYDSFRTSVSGDKTIIKIKTDVTLFQVIPELLKSFRWYSHSEILEELSNAELWGD